VINGDNYYSEEFINKINRDQRPARRIADIDLTEREQEVLELICKGMSNAEIAKFLGVSVRTIDGHRSNLLEKTKAKNSPHLVMFAIKNGLINA